MRRLSSSASWLSDGLAGGGERGRARQQQLDALLGRRVAGEQAQRALEPARGGGRRAQRRGLAGLAQHRDGRRVAVPRRQLDVMRPRGDRSAARGERLGAALVRGESPAAGRRLVDRPADERMPEAEAARDVGRADEVGAQQLVERVQRCVLARSRPRPRRAPGRTARRRRRRPGARAARRRSAVRAPPSAPPRPRRAPRFRRASRLAAARHGAPIAAERARELLEVEGVAAALGVQRVRRGAVARRRRAAPRPPSSDSAPRSMPRQRVAAQCALERGRDLLGHEPRAHRQRDRAPAPPGAGAAAPSASSNEPESAQCRSSRTSTSGR